MEIDFRPLDYGNRADFLQLEKWHNSKSYRDTYSWNPSQEDYLSFVSHESIYKNLLQDKASTHRYFILVNHRPIGEMSYTFNAKHLFKKNEPTVLIHMAICEEMGNNRKKVLNQGLLYLESLAKAENFFCLETSVFEYDYQGTQFYKDSGFKEVGRIPSWTYKAGRMWGDIRMQKSLSKA